MLICPDDVLRAVLPAEVICGAVQVLSAKVQGSSQLKWM